ncbi:MAG: PEGA domain-containing protein [Nanoarchaeota archaeon]
MDFCTFIYRKIYKSAKLLFLSTKEVIIIRYGKLLAISSFILLFALIFFATSGKHNTVVAVTNQTNTSYGNLYIQTNPTTSYVFVDGIYRGISPVTVYDLDTSFTHVIKATKLEFQDAISYVNALAGKTTSIFIILNPLTQQGNIYVQTNPTQSNIYLDGVFRDLSPIFIANISVGNHTVLANKPSYSNASQIVTVLSGQTTNVYFNLQALNYTNQSTGILSIITNPTGAAIYLDNQFKGLTTYQPLIIYAIPAGSHNLKATLNNYENYNQAVYIGPNQVLALNINMTRAAYTCTDSDNGVDIYKQGTAVVTKSDGTVMQRVTDFCTERNKLTEYYCATGSSVASKLYYCNNGCSYGACSTRNIQKVPLSVNTIIIAVLLLIAVGFALGWKKLKKKPNLKLKSKKAAKKKKRL